MRTLPLLFLLTACTGSTPDDDGKDTVTDPDGSLPDTDADTTDPDPPDDTDPVADTDPTPVDTAPVHTADTATPGDTGTIVYPCVGGVFDPTFGGNGHVAYNAPTSEYDTKGWTSLIDRGDGILVGGEYYESPARRTMLLRLLPDGSLDPAFGTGGWVTDTFTELSRISSLAQLPSGKILAGGHIGNLVSVMRFTEDGDLDTGFGTNGWVTHPTLRDQNSRNTMVAQPTGSIVVAGQAGIGSTDAALVRYDPTGVLDTAWGTGGQVTIPGTGTVTVRALLDAGGGDLFALGDDGSDALVARITAGGQLDTTFGTGGITTVDARGHDVFQGARVDDAGNLVLVGTADWSFDWTYDGDWLAARLTPSGSLDPTFGTGGLVVLDIDTVVTATGTQDRAWDVLELSDGDLLIAGRHSFNAQGRMLLARLDSDGTPDACFDTDGWLQMSSGFGVFQQSDVARQLLEAPGGQVYVVGTVNPSAFGFAAVARLAP
jgi:uncharacterized delta-60 repeat protein